MVAVSVDGNTPYQPTLSTHPINTPLQCTLPIDGCTGALYAWGDNLAPATALKPP